MQFLHPLFLGGLAALALPVLIHFVYKMRAPVVPFPSIRFLRMVDRRVAKRQKIEELLLLLLRCLGLACLALSLAGPLIKQFGNSPGSAGTAAVIVLDDSYSMGALASGGPVFNQAKGMSGTILNTFAPGDSVCLLAGTRKAQFSRDLGALRNELKGLELSNDATTLGARVKAGLELLKNAEAAQRELYIVSDFQRRAADIENLPYDLPSFTPILVPTRPANPDKIENLTLTAFEQISPFATVASPVRVRAVIENAGQQTVSRNLRFRNGETTLASQMVSVAARSTVVVSADLALDKPGWLPLSADLADDGLNADNRRWLACDARAYLGVLVCRPNPQGETGASSRSFYIETALNPAGKSATAPSSGVQILTCTPSDFANQNLDSIAVLFMVECAPKDEDGRKLLNNFVARGGGLAIVAGTGITPDIFNTGFYRENDPAGPLSPAKVTGAWGASDADPNHETVAEFIKDVAAQHPIFARLRRGEIPVELSAAAFYHFARVEPAEHFGAQVLARFGNKAPAIVEHPYGLGRVVLIASALHADATQLPLRVSFLPLMQCLTLHLLSTGRSDALKVGEHVSMQLFKDKAPPSAVAIFSPTDRREIAGQQVGNTVTYDFGPAPTPGAIPIEWSDGGRKLNRLVAVNVEPEEGKLEYAEPQSLKIPKAVVVNDEGQLMALLNHIRFGHNLSLLALALAILLLLGEALLANWLAFGRAGGEK